MQTPYFILLPKAGIDCNESSRQNLRYWPIVASAPGIFQFYDLSKLIPDTQAMPKDPAVDLLNVFDLRHLPAAFYDDPFPTYHALRDAEPVRRMPDGSYFLTRYADVQAV